MRHLTMKLPDELYEATKRISIKDRTTVSSTIRLALIELVERRDKSQAGKKLARQMRRRAI